MPLRNFDLNLLRALDALLRERSVTRAAAQLNVTQQAMSGALRRLREEFDDALLIRVGRELQRTPQGEALVMPVRDALTRVEQTLDARPVFDPAASSRRLSVAMSDYAMLTILPLVMADITAQAPRIVLDVRRLDGRTFGALVGNELDLCLLPDDWELFATMPPPGLETLALYDDDFVCVVGCDNRSIGVSLDIDQYLAMRHAALRVGGGVRTLVEIAWRHQGLRPTIAATAPSFAATVLMVVNSPLIATVQRRLAQHFVAMLPVRTVECPVPIERLRESMHWYGFRNNDPALSFLRGCFVDAGHRLSDAPER